LSEYFSTSRFTADPLTVGQIDLNTYPVWWIDEIATTADLSENLRNGSVIPLRAIIDNRGGPSMNRHFNLYYLHWWTLTHYICESEKHQGRILSLLRSGGGLESFEKIIGPVDQVQIEWHSYVRRLKAALAGKDRQFLRTGKISEPAAITPTNPPAGSP